MRIFQVVILMLIVGQSYSQEVPLTCLKFDDKLVFNVQFNEAKDCFIYWGGEKPLTRRPIKLKSAETGIEQVIDSSSLIPSGWLNETEIVFRSNRPQPKGKIPILVRDVFTNETRSITFVDSLSPPWFKVFDNSILFRSKNTRNIRRWDDLTGLFYEYHVNEKGLSNELIYFRKLELLLYTCMDEGMYTIKGYYPKTKMHSVYVRSLPDITNLKIDTANNKLYYIKSKALNLADEICVIDLKNGLHKSLGFLPNGMRVGELDIFKDKLLLSINNENFGSVTIESKDVSFTLKINPSVCTIKVQ